jgi:hypothetical protein
VKTVKPVLGAGLESVCALLEPVAGYALAAKPLHENLRLALLQLSGFLLQRLLARPTAVVDFRPVEAARDVIAGAGADLAALSAPNGARHHRYHLDRALSALRAALASALAIARHDDDLQRALGEAEKHLRAAGRLLPGFAMVDFSQSCCALHQRLAAGWIAE